MLCWQIIRYAFIIRTKIQQNIDLDKLGGVFNTWLYDDAGDDSGAGGVVFLWHGGDVWEPGMLSAVGEQDCGGGHGSTILLYCRVSNVL